MFGRDLALFTPKGIFRSAATADRAIAGQDVAHRLDGIPAPWPMPRRGGGPRRTTVLLMQVHGWLREALRRRRSRRWLADLDANALKDIGVSWSEAEHEANKPWWRA